MADSRMSIVRTSYLGLILALLIGSEAVATLVTQSANQDNTLYEDVTGTTSNGAGDWFFAGTTSRSQQIRRGLIAFNIGSIPAGSTINTVALTLQMDRTISGAQSVSVHRVTSNWGEGTSDAGDPEGMGTAATAGDATWLHTFSDGAGGGTAWTSAGGDFVVGASATTSVAAVGSYTWGSTAAMVADVQSWLDGTNPNYGWTLIGNETTSPTAKRFQSRENSLNPPMLTIGYTVPEPSAFLGLVTSLAVSLYGMNLRRGPHVRS